MAMYRYEAVTASGKRTRGYINADSYEIAKGKLKKESIFVTSVHECGGKDKSKPLSETQKLQFSRDIASLLRSGLPLYEALLTIEEKYAGTAAHRIYLDLSEQVRYGKSLSSALRNHPRSFDEVFCALVEAGEQTGELDKIFLQIEKLYGRQNKLKKQLLSSLMYPAFLFSFCSLVLIVLFFFLIPTMKEMFEGKKLHPITHAVLGISDFLSSHWLGLLIAMGCLIGSLYLFFTSKNGRRVVEKLLLNTPILERILVQASLLRFSQILSVLLKSGVPLIEGIRLSIHVIKIQSLKESVYEGEEAALQGSSLAAALGKNPHFPPLFIRMLSVAEESGNMDAMLLSIANIYDEELERSLTRFTTMLQPIILLFLGIIVGIVLIAVLLPMSDISAVLN